MSTITRLEEPDSEYGHHALRYDPRAGRGMTEGHIARGTFCLGHMSIPLLSFDATKSAYLLTVSSDSDPDHCIEIVLDEEDFTRAFQQARMSRVAATTERTP